MYIAIDFTMQEGLIIEERATGKVMIRQINVSDWNGDHWDHEQQVTGEEFYQRFVDASNKMFAFIRERSIKLFPVGGFTDEELGSQI